MSAEKRWVSVREAAARTGYNEDYLRQLLKKIWDQPETERTIRLERKGARYRIWMPDLLKFIERHAYGPYNKTEKNGVDDGAV